MSLDVERLREKINQEIDRIDEVLHIDGDPKVQDMLTGQQQGLSLVLWFLRDA